MSFFGEKIKLTVFGESHGEAIGAVLCGVPAGYKINMDGIYTQMARRAPGRDATATPRLEKDFPVVKSGLLNGITTGAPIAAIIENTNTRSGDYDNILKTPRPAHSDYTAFVKYCGFNDVRGGGHFSGRLTAPIVFAGALLRQILERKGIRIAAHIAAIGGVSDARFEPVAIDSELISRLNGEAFALIDRKKENEMRAAVEAARQDGDSVGGVVECAVVGMPVGVGGPLFEGIEGKIAQAVFAVPAVKGVEFGLGFNCAEVRGSVNNDAFEFDGGKVVTKTNNAGGVLGGISNGMPIIFRAAFKPTPSIAAEQDTVDLESKTETKLSIKGRHDPCVVPRAVSVVEAAAAIAVFDMIG